MENYNSEYEEETRKNYFCTSCLSMEEEDCCCSENDSEEVSEENARLLSASCRCGAWQNGYHVADCVCGAE